MCKLSILIATIPERIEQLNALVWKLQVQIEPYDCEIIINATPRYDEVGGITVGEKRQRLIDSAKGKYIVFVDDDDDVTDTFVEDIYHLLDQDVDVINPKVLAYIDGKKHIIDQSIHYTSEQLHGGETKRYPSVMSIWNRNLTHKAKFEHLNNGEDFNWTKQMNPQTEIKLDTFCQIYNYSSYKTVASKATRRCIVTFSNTDRYNKLAERLTESAKQYNIDVLWYKYYHEINSPPHNEYPYAFKPYAIQKARELGYNSILWLDSAIHITQSPEQVFQHIERNGVLLFDNTGHNLGEWTSDVCLDHLKIGREESFSLKMVMACAMGFNFNTEIGTTTFDTYLGFATTNAYQGSWTNHNQEISKDTRVRGHRHDQSVISCIAHNKSLSLLVPNQTFIAYEGNEGHKPHEETVCLISNG